jgi:AcrR family transcriptional regulator
MINPLLISLKGVKKVENTKSTKDYILNSVLDIIGKRGINGLTIREIAREANVNSAAISYYFGSKEKLFEEAFQYYITEAHKIFENLQNSNEAPRARLKQFCVSYTEHMLAFPGLLKTQISFYILEDTVRPDVKERVENDLNSIRKVLAEILDKADEQTLLYKSVQLMSSLVYPALLNKYGSGISSIEFDSATSKYIDVLLEGVINC